MKAAAGEARNSTGPAMSSGSPQRPSGVRALTDGDMGRVGAGCAPTARSR